MISVFSMIIVFSVLAKFLIETQKFKKGGTTLIEYDGETYVTVTDVARHFKLSRGTCYNNLLQQVQKCYLPGRKHAMYKQSDVEQFSRVRIAESVKRKESPAQLTTAQAGNPVTSSSNSVDWQSQYSLPVQQIQHPITNTQEHSYAD